MCYGSLDLKFATQETDMRLKGLCRQTFASGCETECSPASAPAPGLGEWMRTMVARLKRKDLSHV
jgi:hypothetical protein